MVKQPLRNNICKSIIMVLLLHSTAYAQLSRLGNDIEVNASLTAIASGGDTSPFWFANNCYGLGSPNNNYGYLRIGAGRDIATDYDRNWRLGYGADIVGSVGMDSHFVLQQLFADVQWKALRLSLGQKERPLELKNQLLSSGAMTTGINTRPLPQVRLELPDFWTIPGTKHWLALKAHIAYGFYTDNKWQRQFIGDARNKYTANSFYHSKAGFLRIGNAEVFPLTLTGGFEMAAQFGGEAWNLQDRIDHADDGTFDPHQKLPSGISAFWHAFIPGGSDSNDGDFSNVAGNQLGSWHLRLDYTGQKWQAGVYLEHFFEDQSQLFWQYGWKDLLIGAEINLPRNPYLSTIVYEHVGTMDQSGPIYHDATETLPVQISAVDEYYNHHIYGAWQHAGFGMGNPLLVSPLYNKVLFEGTKANTIYTFHNRINAHHIGLSGNPLPNLSWRFMYTHTRSLGTYHEPCADPQSANYLMAEATYRMQRVPGLSLTVAYGHNSGDLLGKSNGGMLTIAYTNLFRKSN